VDARAEVSNGLPAAAARLFKVDLMHRGLYKRKTELWLANASLAWCRPESNTRSAFHQLYKLTISSWEQFNDLHTG